MSTKLAKNATGLLLAVYGALADDETGQPRAHVLSAIVHGWYEGHIAGENTRRRPAHAISQLMGFAAEDGFPSPPFPNPREKEIDIILAEVGRRFAIDVLAPGAVAFAAGLAWAHGYNEGRRCHGCSFRGYFPSVADLAREGLMPVPWEAAFRGLAKARGSGSAPRAKKRRAGGR